MAMAIAPLLACHPTPHAIPGPILGQRCFEQTYQTPNSLEQPSATLVDTILLDTVPGFRWRDDERPQRWKGYRVPIAEYQAYASGNPEFWFGILWFQEGDSLFLSESSLSGTATVARLAPPGYVGVRRYWSDDMILDSLGNPTIIYFESPVVARAVDCRAVDEDQRFPAGGG